MLANLRRISLARESVDGESANEASEPALRVELTSVNPYDGVKAELANVDGVNVDGSCISEVVLVIGVKLARPVVVLGPPVIELCE